MVMLFCCIPGVIILVCTALSTFSGLLDSGHEFFSIAAQATVQVPLDAYKMDFVFADVEAGEGTYDNHGGFDYHLPVEGSGLAEPALHVVHVSLEMAPICKAGPHAWLGPCESPEHVQPPQPSRPGLHVSGCSVDVHRSFTHWVCRLAASGTWSPRWGEPCRRPATW